MVNPSTSKLDQCFRELSLTVPACESFKPVTSEEQLALTGKISGIIDQAFAAVDEDSLRSVEMQKIYELSGRAAEMGLLTSEATAKIEHYVNGPRELDVKIIAQGGEIIEINNSDLLRQNSEYFKSMLDPSLLWNESKEKRIDFSEFPKDTIEFVLKCLQTPDSVKIDLRPDAKIDTVLQLMRLGTEFMFDTLLQKFQAPLLDFMKENKGAIYENAPELFYRLNNQMKLDQDSLDKYILDNRKTLAKLLGTVTECVLEELQIPVKSDESGAIEIPLSSAEGYFAAFETFRKDFEVNLVNLPVSLVINGKEDIDLFIQKCSNPFPEKVKLTCVDLPNSAIKRLKEFGEANKIEIEFEKIRFTNGYGCYIPPNTKVIGPKAYKIFDDIGEVVPIPSHYDLEEILLSNDPLNNGKSRIETQMLVYFPKEIDDKPLTINHFRDKVQKYKEGNDQFKWFNYSVRDQFGYEPPKESYWALITADVIDDSRSKTLEDQLKLFEKDPDYELPAAREAFLAIMMEYLQSGTRLFGQDPWTYTRCKEQVHDIWPVVVGGFGSSGLDVYNDQYDGFVDVFIGVAGLRKFA